MENRVKEKVDYILKVSEVSSRDYDEVKQEMINLKKGMGITFREFYNNELWLKTPTQQNIRARYILRDRERKNQNFEKIKAALGLEKSEVRERIREINQKGIYFMNLAYYGNFEVYRYSEEELDDVLHLFARRKALKTSLDEKLMAIDDGILSYDALTEEVTELYAITEKLMPKSMEEMLIEKITISRPDLKSDPKKLHDVVIDMNVTWYWLGFTYPEYVSFHFVDKTIAEKHAFISDRERMKVIKTINDEGQFDLLDDKSKTYSVLKKYYGRKMLKITSNRDYRKFKWFCFGKKTIVVKPFFDSMGRGIKPIPLQEEKTIREAFKELRKDYRQFIVEDLITAHEDIKRLNPDSVNTVRVITYFDGEKSIIHSTFMKVGKAGSFVDNGGAGGIFVCIDPETGIMTTSGCDENGVRYETHPDTGVKFEGYQLPNWEDLRKLGLKLSTKLPGISYIGWDMTCTKKGKWIIVEGNGKTQFFGQQCTTGVGKRQDFFDTVHYKPGK